MKRLMVTSLVGIALLLLSACGTSTPATATPTPAKPIQLATREITNKAVRIVQEQGSGAACNPNATYFVYLDISSNGPTSSQYRIDATDASGQVPDGVFDPSGTPEVKGTLTFKSAETQSVKLRLTGPYSYPDGITIRAYVDGKDLAPVSVVCK